VCGDVIFSSRCRFFVIFQPFFDPSKRPPKWPKNGAPSWSLGEHQNDHDKHTCEVASSSAYVRIIVFDAYYIYIYIREAHARVVMCTKKDSNKMSILGLSMGVQADVIH
jgi:hypothetical protein